MNDKSTGRTYAGLPQVFISLVGAVFAILLFPGFSAAADPAGWDPQIKALGRIPAGTTFGQQPPAGWSNIILFVEGRLGSGDVAAASSTAHYYAELFNLVFLANVAQETGGSYKLDKVAVGFSMKINGRNTIITTDTQKQLGANLSVIGRSVLSGNEAAVQDIQQVARYDTSMIFDAPTVMLYNGDHRKMMVRFLIWVSPSNGRLGTTVWLLDKQLAERDYRVVEKTFQYLPANMREKRIMNVKGDRFTFGIPSEDAFALVRIPPGTPYPITERMRKAAGRARFTAATYREVLASVDEAMKSGRTANDASARSSVAR